MPRFLTSLITAAILAASVVCAQEAPPAVDPDVSFSGTRQIQTAVGVRDVFIRQAPDKIRMEVAQGSRKAIHIVRLDMGAAYMLIPQMNAYQKMPLQRSSVETTDLVFAEGGFVGEDEVDGVACTRFQGRVSDSTGHTAEGTYCASADGVVMEVDMVYDDAAKLGKPLRYTMRDVDVGEQDPSVFEVPSGYRDLSSGVAGQ